MDTKQQITQQPKPDDLKENNMSSITTSEQIQTMNSLEIAELCDKRHADVMRDITIMFEQLKITEEGQRKFAHTYIHPQNKQSYPCYKLDKEHSLCLVAGYSAQLRMKIIKRWQELENKVVNPALPDFTNPAEAAIAWANQYKERSALQLELKEKAPLIGFAETVAIAKNAILVRELAYLAQNDYKIKIGEKRLWEWLRFNGYVHKNSTRPMQKALELDLFVMQEHAINHTHGVEVHFTTKVTGKGQLYFINKLKTQFNHQVH